jgi:RNA polymerase sigma-70 factor, ECF subfamily
MVPAEALGEVHEAYERCQLRYPTIRLDFKLFLARIQEIVGEATAGKDSTGVTDCHGWRLAFSALHHEDLFLALACVQGDRVAWECFAESFLPLIRRFAGGSCKNLEEQEDLAQEIVTVLMAGVEAEKATKLARYNGRGSLAGWLRVTVAHAAIDRFRRSKRLISLEEMLEHGKEPTARGKGAPHYREEEKVDSRWGAVLAELLAQEIERLASRDRLLLRLYYLDGVPLKMIGGQFGVHEATASRWLETLRRNIRKRVEKQLRKKYGMSSRDLRSVWCWASEEGAPWLEGLLVQSSSEQ